ncbi:hypothetical protein EJ05DRAFT_480176 [Pseudovirgaria hyperparasitica]|uniref:RING-type domain-containing protein n=1 Tax=Pseudovirgaria hyperparasitica TaxID=470096 RepID=A0A6A6VSZ0_9PEZI|nr:uncharacterized protein EJ05DRAFT_480176 [Pseudovirgaria hyperparasitica]KAF2753702.1 hypothetical protein EJ05DRAFT_480176 [Pseudovirgaria hyperparasitica]
MPITSRHNPRTESSTLAKPAVQSSAPAGREPQTEQERIDAMFQSSANQWEQQKQQMATAKPVRPGFKPKQITVPEHEPPVGYVCYRCHQKGHWIQACPTNDDPNFENKPRIKRTTGIPRSFLKTVEKPTALANDGFTDDTKQPAGVMINAEGEYVIAEPDKAAWEQYQAKAKATQAQQEAAAKGNQELRDRGLECPLDMRMFVDPKKTPCCGHTYCIDCIENALLDSDFVCPNCSTPGVLLDNLVADDDMAKRIREYEDEKSQAKKDEVAASSAATAAATTAKSPKPDSEDTIKNQNSEFKPEKSSSKSPSPAPTSKPANETSPEGDAPAATGDPSSNKRSAEEELENNRIPSAPAAMRKQLEQQKAAEEAAAKANDPTNQFIEQMDNLDQMMKNGQPNMPFSNMGFPNQMAMMSQMGMGMGMGMGLPMGNGMGMMTGMMGMSNGMTPMMQQNGSWGNMNGMGGVYQQNGMFNNYNSGRNMNGYGGNQQWQGHQQHASGPSGWNQNSTHQNGFPNQQRTFFSEPLGNEEDNAYFRKPVNPHRHQSRQRRTQRPSDFKEL